MRRRRRCAATTAVPPAPPRCYPALPAEPACPAVRGPWICARTVDGEGKACFARRLPGASCAPCWFCGPITRYAIARMSVRALGKAIHQCLRAHTARGRARRLSAHTSLLVPHTANSSLDRRHSSPVAVLSNRTNGNALEVELSRAVALSAYLPASRGTRDTALGWHGTDQCPPCVTVWSVLCVSRCHPHVPPPWPTIHHAPATCPVLAHTRLRVPPCCSCSSRSRLARPPRR